MKLLSFLLLESIPSWTIALLLFIHLIQEPNNACCCFAFSSFHQSRHQYYGCNKRREDIVRRQQERHGIIREHTTISSTRVQQCASSVIQNIQDAKTELDISMEQWYRSQGILGTSHIALCTSDALSVGGRGLFWIHQHQEQHAAMNSNDHQDSRGKDESILKVTDARQGDILAYIPSKCVLTCISASSSSSSSISNNKEEVPAASWQAQLTAHVIKLLLQNPATPSNHTTIMQTKHHQKEWIQSWLMGEDSCQNFLDLKPAHEYSLEQIHTLAESVGMKCLQQQLDTVKEALQKRYKTFVRDRNSVMNILVKESLHYSTSDIRDNLTFSLLLENVYKLVLSRLASLGPQWNNQRGIIPFHDMVNHPPGNRQSNVELFTFADVTQRIGHDATCDMIRKLAQCSDERTKNDNDADVNNMDDKDLLVVATRDIHQGDELWLSYKQCTVTGEYDPRQLLWWTLQYGFPIT